MESPEIPVRHSPVIPYRAPNQKVTTNVAETSTVATTSHADNTSDATLAVDETPTPSQKRQRLTYAQWRSTSVALPTRPANLTPTTPELLSESPSIPIGPSSVAPSPATQALVTTPEPVPLSPVSFSPESGPQTPQAATLMLAGTPEAETAVVAQSPSPIPYRPYVICHHVAKGDDMEDRFIIRYMNDTSGARFERTKKEIEEDEEYKSYKELNFAPLWDLAEVQDYYTTSKRYTILWADGSTTCQIFSRDCHGAWESFVRFHDKTVKSLETGRSQPDANQGWFEDQIELHRSKSLYITHEMQKLIQKGNDSLVSDRDKYVELAK